MSQRHKVEGATNGEGGEAHWLLGKVGPVYTAPTQATTYTQYDNVGVLLETIT